MHHRGDGSSYAHNHGLRPFKGAKPLAFTPHHHEPNETFPEGHDLPLVDDDGAPLGPGDIVVFDWTEPEFESSGRYHVSGRGEVFTVSGDYPEPGELKGKTVVIDGARYEVRGVETFGIRPYPENMNFGLLVRPLGEEQQ